MKDAIELKIEDLSDLSMSDADFSPEPTSKPWPSPSAHATSAIVLESPPQSSVKNESKVSVPSKNLPELKLTEVHDSRSQPIPSENPPGGLPDPKSSNSEGTPELKPSSLPEHKPSDSDGPAESQSSENFPDPKEPPIPNFTQKNPPKDKNKVTEELCSEDQGSSKSQMTRKKLTSQAQSEDKDSSCGIDAKISITSISSAKSWSISNINAASSSSHQIRVDQLSPIKSASKRSSSSSGLKPGTYSGNFCKSLFNGDLSGRSKPNVFVSHGLHTSTSTRSIDKIKTSSSKGPLSNRDSMKMASQIYGSAPPGGRNRVKKDSGSRRSSLLKEERAERSKRDSLRGSQDKISKPIKPEDEQDADVATSKKMDENGKETTCDTEKKDPRESIPDHIPTSTVVKDSKKPEASNLVQIESDTLGEAHTDGVATNKINTEVDTSGDLKAGGKEMDPESEIDGVAKEKVDKSTGQSNQNIVDAVKMEEAVGI